MKGAAPRDRVDGRTVAGPSASSWSRTAARRAGAESRTARSGTVRGDLWSAVIAADFFFLSNPLALVPTFQESLRIAVIVTVVMAALHVPSFRLARPPVSVVLFLSWTAISAFWSIDQDATWNSVGIYVVVAALALVIASNVSAGAIAQGLAWGGTAVVIASVIALQKSVPGVAIPQGGEGYMAGVGTNRNILAYTLVLSLCFVLSVNPRGVSSLLKWFVVLAVTMCGIFLSSSGTGIVSSAAALVAAGGVRAWGPVRARLGGRARRSMFVLMGACVVALIVFYGQLVALLGRDGRTLSGRVPLWEAIVDVTQPSALEGFGWGAVWPYPWATAPDNEVVERIYDAAGIVLAHGHNSWFDIYPAIGIVGVVLAVGVYAQVWVSAYSVARAPEFSEQRVFVRLAVIVLVGHLVFGLTEPIFSIPLGWFVLVLMAGLAVPARRRAQAASQGRVRTRTAVCQPRHRRPREGVLRHLVVSPHLHRSSSRSVMLVPAAVRAET